MSLTSVEQLLLRVYGIPQATIDEIETSLPVVAKLVVLLKSNQGLIDKAVSLAKQVQPLAAEALPLISEAVAEIESVLPTIQDVLAVIQSKDAGASPQPDM